MVARLARTAATKIPWDKIVKAALPVLIDQTTKLLSKIGRRKPPQADLHSTPETRITALEKYVEGLEQDLKEAVKALENTATELSLLASAGKVLTARITISLLLSGLAAIIAVACFILVSLHR
jgi:hypothetical protein